jgi:hypothetical protein
MSIEGSDQNGHEAPRYNETDLRKRKADKDMGLLMNKGGGGCRLQLPEATVLSTSIGNYETWAPLARPSSTCHLSTTA